MKITWIAAAAFLIFAIPQAEAGPVYKRCLSGCQSQGKRCHAKALAYVKKVRRACDHNFRRMPAGRRNCHRLASKQFMQNLQRCTNNKYACEKRCTRSCSLQACGNAYRQALAKLNRNVYAMRRAYNGCMRRYGRTPLRSRCVRFNAYINRANAVLKRRLDKGARTCRSIHRSRRFMLRTLRQFPQCKISVASDYSRYSYRCYHAIVYSAVCR